MLSHFFGSSSNQTMKTRGLKRIERDRIELDSAEMQQALRSPCRYDAKTQLCSIRHNESATVWEKHGADGWRTVKREEFKDEEDVSALKYPKEDTSGIHDHEYVSIIDTYREHPRLVLQGCAARNRRVENDPNRPYCSIVVFQTHCSALFLSMFRYSLIVFLIM